jgi:hypothetical protein
MVVIRGRLTPEAGAVLMQALAAARETLYRRARGTEAAETQDFRGNVLDGPVECGDGVVTAPGAVRSLRSGTGGR